MMKPFGLRSYSRGHRKPQKGITFVEVAIVLPIAIFFLMGIVDFGLLMLSRYQMASVASTIARRIEDTPRINPTTLNTFILDALAGLRGTNRSVGIASYATLPSSGWFNNVPSGQRNYSLTQDQYFVGVVVRMNLESSSIISPYLKRLIPRDTYVSSALVPVKNLQNCGPSRVLVGDNQGSYRCGPNCGPGQMPVVSAGNQVVCSPAGAEGQLLSFGPGGGSLVNRLVPPCSNPGQKLIFDGRNFSCASFVPACSSPGDVLQFNGSNFSCAQFFSGNEFNVTGGSESQCGDGNRMKCPTGSYQIGYRLWVTSSNVTSCAVRCRRAR